MGRSVLILVSLAASLFIAPAAAARDSADELGKVIEKKTAVKMAPATGWNLEAAEDRCRLSRQFSSTDGDHLLYIEQIAPGPRFDLTLAGPLLANWSTQRWLYRGMRSDRDFETIDPLNGAMRDFGASMIMPSVSLAVDADRSELISATIDPSDAEKVERVVIRQGTRIVSFETGNLEPVLAALNTCTLDLLPYWGLDLETHKSFRPPEMPDERSYFAGLRHEYAKISGAKGHKALLRIRLIIDREGVVSSCFEEIAASSGGEPPQICENISTVRFKPAVNAAGDPIPSFFARSVPLWSYSPYTADAHGGRWGDD